MFWWIRNTKYAIYYCYYIFHSLFLFSVLGSSMSLLSIQLCGVQLSGQRYFSLKASVNINPCTAIFSLRSMDSILIPVCLLQHFNTLPQSLVLHFVPLSLIQTCMLYILVHGLEHGCNLNALLQLYSSMTLVLQP